MVTSFNQCFLCLIGFIVCYDNMWSYKHAGYGFYNKQNKQEADKIILLLYCTERQNNPKTC